MGRTLLKAWLEARGDNLVPTIRQFGPRQMQAITSNVYVIQIMPDGTHKLALFGSALADWHGVDQTGVDAVDMNPPEDREAARLLHRTVVGAPAIGQSFRWYKTRFDRLLIVEQVLVPVADEDGSVRRLVAIVDDVPEEADVAFTQTTEAERSTAAPLGNLRERTVFDLNTGRAMETPLNVPPLDAVRRSLVIGPLS